MLRLYLDTGDLLAIADRRTPAAVVEALREAVGGANAWLVVSRAHIQDAVSQADAPTKERFVRTVEAFENLLAIVEGPEFVEPLSVPSADIAVQPCDNFRDLVFCEPAERWLSEANESQDEMHAGSCAARRVAIEAASPSRPRPVAELRREAKHIALSCKVTLIRGAVERDRWLGDDPIVLLAYWEQKSGCVLSNEEREAILRETRATAEMMRPLRGTIERNGLDPTSIMRRLAAANDDPARYPGLHLMLRVATLRQEDQRQRLRSDWVDYDHVAHFPYVHIATCDRGTYHAVTGALRRLDEARRPALFRNGNLPKVTQWLLQHSS